MNPTPSPADPSERRTFLKHAVSLAAGAALLPAARAAAPEASAAHQGKRKAPRLYYHHDGSFMMYVPPPITQERFVYEIVERLLGTQVEGIVCHMFSFGDTVPLFKSDIPDSELVEPKQLKTVNNWRNVQNLRALRTFANDPWEAAITMAHAHGKEFWAAMRFNDGHPDSYGLRSRFSILHPEYLIKGDVHRDFSIPAVRAYRLRQVEEVCTRYDLDGFEFDLTRDIGVHFPPEKQAEGEGILTAFLGEVRQVLNRVGEGRGRPLKVGLRVPATPAVCKRVGYDVAAWIKSGIVDVLTPSIYYDTSCDVPFAAFVELARGSSCLVYASVSEGVGPGRFNPPPPEAVRAAALNAWRQGVDGINLFNFHHQTVTNRVQDIALLSEIGSPQSLERSRKLYMIAGHAFVYQGQNKSITEYVPAEPVFGDNPRQLPASIPVGGPPLSIRVPIGDRLEDARRRNLLAAVVLRLDLCNVTGSEEMDILWNGRRIPLAMAKMEVGQQYPWNWNGLHGQLEARFDLTHGDWVRGGDNLLEVRLLKRPPEIIPDFLLWAVRVEVEYNVLPMRLGLQAGG